MVIVLYPSFSCLVLVSVKPDFKTPYLFIHYLHYIEDYTELVYSLYDCWTMLRFSLQYCNILNNGIFCNNAISNIFVYHVTLSAGRGGSKLFSLWRQIERKREASYTSQENSRPSFLFRLFFLWQILGCFRGHIRNPDSFSTA